MSSEDVDRKFLLLYATQTGQAKAIAEEFNDIALSEGLEPDLHCFSLIDKKFSLEKARVAVIITSTTGDGEPPETAIKLYRRLKRTTLLDNHLAHLSYSLLGLGDTNYNSFCNFGKSLNRRLLELGAKQLYPSDWADDATGLEIVTEPWMDGCVVALKEYFENSTTESPLPQSNLNHSIQISNNLAPSGESKAVINELINNQLNLAHANRIIEFDGDIDNIGNSKVVSDDLNVKSAAENTTNIVIHTDITSQLENSHVDIQHKLDSETERTEGITDSTLPSESADISTSGDIVKDTNEILVASVSVADTDSVSDNIEKEDNTSNTSENINNKNNSSSVSKDSTDQNSTDQSNNKADLIAGQKNFENQKSISAEMQAKEESNEQAVMAGGASTTDSIVSKLGSVSIESESLVYSLSPLSSGSLSLPLASPPYLTVTYHPELTPQKLEVIQNNSPFSGSVSETKSVPIRSARVLTRADAVKTALEIELDISECGWVYEPGDTVGVVCENDDDDVSYLIGRLDLTDVSKVPCHVGVLEKTTKKNAAVPDYIPATNSTLYHILKTCVELRHVPRKAMLRCLADSTSDPSERRRLQELCSKQGADHYTRFIREPTVTFIDILHSFPSCKPSIELVLEHLPRLLPRPYSVSSSLLSSASRLSFVFNIIEIPAGAGRRGYRHGVCTGWLNNLTLKMRGEIEAGEYSQIETGNDSDLQSTNEELESTSGLTVPIFMRRNLFFHLPADLSTPIIMIGPGTGVAPFVGFLEHRRELRKMGDGADGGCSYGATWLFYGCRHRDRDYLYRERLRGFVDNGTLSRLLVCFSRDTCIYEDHKLNVRDSAESAVTHTGGVSEADERIEKPRYVQDMMKKCGEELSSLIHDCNAVVYVCGDARGMAPQVLTTIKQILVQHKAMEDSDADAFISKMRLDKRYLEDVWT